MVVLARLRREGLPPPGGDLMAVEAVEAEAEVGATGAGGSHLNPDPLHGAGAHRRPRRHPGEPWSTSCCAQVCWGLGFRV